MSERFFIGYFEDERRLIQAIKEARCRGYRVLDAFSPYPVHALPDAMGLAPSRLTWIGLWAGIIGLVLGLTLQVWTSAYDWPLIVGGQPFNSWPVFVPVSFELTVLFAGVIGVIALFIRAKLWPGRAAPRLRCVTNDRFALALTVADASVDTEEILQFLRERGATETLEGDELADRIDPAEGVARKPSLSQKLAWCAIVLLPVVVLGGLWAARRDLTKPNRILPTQMAVSPAYRSQSANPVFASQITLQLPAEGTLARGGHLFPYAKTDADRRRAGKELANPFRPTPETLQRGKNLYETYCLVCHGASGAGDGPVIPKFPNPPNFHSQQSKALKDGEMFHTITLGRRKMASYASQVSWDDRWKIILYIR